MSDQIYTNKVAIDNLATVSVILLENSLISQAFINRDELDKNSIALLGYK